MLRSNIVALDASTMANLRDKGSSWCSRNSKGDRVRHSSSPIKKEKEQEDGADEEKSEESKVKVEEEVVVMANPGGRAEWMARVREGDVHELAECLLEIEAAIHDTQDEGESYISQ